MKGKIEINKKKGFMIEYNCVSSSNIYLRCSWVQNQGEFEDLFLKFGQGLGQAVLDTDLESIRMSINFCCRTDIHVNDRQLIDLATEIGNEEIIKIIHRATPYLV